MTLEAIGQKLKSAREAQGLSLRQIYERTKIPINHLQSIDTGSPDDLPEPVYVAGFIKRYAECIGLDGQVLADEYRREDSSSGHGNGRQRNAVAQQVYITPEYLKHTRIDQRPPSWKMWPFFAFAIVGVIGLVSLFTKYAPVQQQDPNVLSLKDAASQMQNAQPAGVSADTANPVTPAPADDKLVLTVNRHVWVNVTRLSTGDPIYTGSLENGDTREFQDSQGLRIVAADAGALSVEVKGKIEPFGPSGQRIERTFDTHSSVATTPGQDANQTGNPVATGSAQTGAAAPTVVKPRKIRKSSDESATAAAPRQRRLDDGGFRSIGGDSGTRSMDVPYRYSEGRLDAN